MNMVAEPIWDKEQVNTYEGQNSFVCVFLFWVMWEGENYVVWSKHMEDEAENQHMRRMVYTKNHTQIGDTFRFVTKYTMEDYI